MAELENILKSFYLEVYLPHFFEISWTPKYNKVIRDTLRPGDKRLGYDFASSYAHKSVSTLCCQRFRHTNMEVFIVDRPKKKALTIRKMTTIDPQLGVKKFKYTTISKREITPWFFYTANKPDARLHNAAEDHIMKIYDINPRATHEFPFFDSVDAPFSWDDFSREAIATPWIFSVSDNCSAQYRSPRHYFQISRRGFQYGYFSIHTFNPPQHGKQQADPAGGTEHSFSRDAELRGTRLDNHWSLYDYMIQKRPSTQKQKSRKYQLSGPINRAFIDDAPLDDEKIIQLMNQSPHHIFPSSSYIRVDSTCTDSCSSIPQSSLYTQFACFTLSKYTLTQPIWLREFGCVCASCKIGNFQSCGYLDTVGPWRLNFVNPSVAMDSATASRVSFRLDLNKWIKQTRKRSDETGVLLAVKGTCEVDQNSSNGTHLSYWLAEALTLVRKTKKIIDPGNNPGDIIPKGGFFLKVKYFMLKDMASLKYVVAPMGVAFVDFVNVVTCTRFYWNKIYRGQNPSSQIYQLSRRTHGLISYQVKLHGSL